MIRFDEWYLPDGEEHLQTWMRHTNHRVSGRLTYQKSKYDAAMQYVQQRRVAVDVGSHVGLWAYWMARDFGEVHCFEPKSEHADCWRANMGDAVNAVLYQTALGAEAREVGLRTGPSSSGDTGVVLTETGTPMKTLDSFALADVDLIKIDCEGFEAFVLDGATDLLQRCKPTVIVEQKPGHGQRFGRGELDAVFLLEKMGAKRVWEYAGDYVLSFKKTSH